MTPLLMLLLAGGVLAQQQQAEAIPTFRAGVALVRVDAQVVRRGSGRAITDLTQQDFIVYDNNQAQTVAYFGRDSEPLDLLLLLDVSGSMHRSIEELAATARAALGVLGSGDRVALMLFARRAEVAQEFTRDYPAVAAEIGQAVREKGLGAGTQINASIIAAAQYLNGQSRHGRRAILIVTDNFGVNYVIPDETVLKELFRADSVLNAIVVGRAERPRPPKPGRIVNPDFTPSDVFKLSEQSGGEAVQGSGKVAQLFVQMMERIRSRYALHYPAPETGTGEYHQVRVELASEARRRYPDALVRARAGYYTPAK